MTEAKRVEHCGCLIQAEGTIHAYIGSGECKYPEVLKENAALREAVKWCGGHVYSGALCFEDIEPLKSLLARIEKGNS